VINDREFEGIIELSLYSAKIEERKKGFAVLIFVF